MYTKEIKLQDNEIPAKINVETGEITEVKHNPNNIPQGKEKLDFMFAKLNVGPVWDYLMDRLTPLELKVVVKMCLMAKMNSNSLEPLNDETTIPELMETFKVSKNVIRPILDKLFNYGVYGKFQVKKVNTPYTKYWILNPYLSYSGKLIYSDIKSLFDGTKIQKVHDNPSEYLI